MDALIYLVAAIVICGVLLWGMEQLPMDATLKQVARVLVIVILVIYAVYVVLGMVGHAPVWRR